MNYVLIVYVNLHIAKLRNWSEFDGKKFSPFAILTIYFVGGGEYLWEMLKKSSR
jgi:hypothetical protein